jgi:hypothetical protein
MPSQSTPHATIKAIPSQTNGFIVSSSSKRLPWGNVQPVAWFRELRYDYRINLR